MAASYGLGSAVKLMGWATPSVLFILSPSPPLWNPCPNGTILVHLLSIYSWTIITGRVCSKTHFAVCDFEWPWADAKHTCAKITGFQLMCSQEHIIQREIKYKYNLFIFYQRSLFKSVNYILELRTQMNPNFSFWQMWEPENLWGSEWDKEEIATFQTQWPGTRNTMMNNANHWLLFSNHRIDARLAQVLLHTY